MVKQYQWVINDDTIATGPSTMTFETVVSLDDCIPHLQINDPDYHGCTGLVQYKVIATNTITGCQKEQVFYMLDKVVFCPILESQSQQTPPSLSTKIYPNPGNHNVTFYYEVYADQAFSGTVRIYSLTGALIKQKQIEGAKEYTLDFSLLSPGLYFIQTITNTGKVKTDKIIIK